MSCSKSCTRCHALKKKCVRASADAPCAHCQKHGLECVPHVRAAWGTKKRKRGRPKKKRARPSKKTKKTNTAGASAGAQPEGSGAPDIREEVKKMKEASESFLGLQVDLNGFQMLKNLSPSHWGLKCAVICILSMAYKKMNMTLLSVASSFAMKVGFAEYFPVLCSRRVLRDVKVGVYDDVPSHVLRSHDKAVGVSPSAAGQWNNDTGRMILISQKEFDASGALIVLSPEARRLLVRDEEFSGLTTVFNPHDNIASSVLETSDYSAISHADVVSVTQYETKFSGPRTVCTPNVTLHTLEGGRVPTHAYTTLWFGHTGYDGCYIFEFVPVERVSPAATATIIRATKAEEEQAARAMVSFREN